MGKDPDDFFDKIRQINRQNATSDAAAQPETVSAPAAPRTFRERLAEYAPGLVLIAWTVLPLSLAFLFPDSLWPLQCIYPLLSPPAWIAIAGLRPDKASTTIAMGIVGHALLAASLWYIVTDSLGRSNQAYFGFDVLGLLVILAELAYSLVGSILAILFAAHYFAAKPAAPAKE